MNLKDFEEEIEENLAKMKNGKKKRQLEKMYLKMKGRKVLKVGNTYDDTNIDEVKDHYEEKLTEKIKENN